MSWWALHYNLFCGDILCLYFTAILIQTQPKMQKIFWGLQTSHFATLDGRDVWSIGASLQMIYSCWFEPPPLDVTACKLSFFELLSHTHTHTLTPALLLHADVWAWSLTKRLELDQNVECNKAILSKRRGDQNVNLTPQTVRSML